MIEKSQVLSTVQQIKLRRLELELEALKEQVEGQCNSERESLIEKSNRLVSSKTAHSTL